MAIDSARDFEEAINMLDRLQGHGRDDYIGRALGLLAGAGGDIGQFEEIPSAM